MEPSLNMILRISAGTFCLFILFNLTTYGQKPEDIQSTNLLVSAIKVDGRLNDWPAPLKATNRHTNLSYTIANDQKYIYLVIFSSNLINNRKILLGGITITINGDGKKKTKEAYSLTYPVVNRNSLRQVMAGSRGTRNSGQTPGGGTVFQRTQTQRDSIQIAQSKMQLSKAKDIKILGFKNITDTLISIYNEYNIKSAANIDDVGALTYEVGIPIELLNLSPNIEFSYNIQVNGMQINGSGGGSSAGGAGTRFTGGGGFGGGRNVGAMPGGGNRGSGMDWQSMISPTDLWGKYTLAR